MERHGVETGGCTSWYLDANGRNTTLWPGHTTEFRRATRQVDLARVRARRPADPAIAAARAAAAVRTPPQPPGAPGDARPTTSSRRRRASCSPSPADGARLHVEVHGPDDAPAVVLAHGWTCSTAFWAAQIRELAADHRVVAYDQRGHGAQPRRARPATRPRRSPTTWKPCSTATLPAGEQAVVAGHSMGGMT